MLSHIAALKRVQFYEDSLGRRDASASDPSTREEMKKFQEIFRRQAFELETARESLVES